MCLSFPTPELVSAREPPCKGVVLPWSHITCYCTSARFCNAVSFAEKALRHSRCWETAGSKSLVSVTSILLSWSGDQGFSQGCKMCSMKTTTFLIYNEGGQNAFLMVVWKFDFPWGVSLFIYSYKIQSPVSSTWAMRQQTWCCSFGHSLLESLECVAAVEPSACSS